MNKRFFKCSRCGHSMTKDYGLMCMEPVTFRTSGVCGGSLDEEITKEEYEKTLIKWEELRKTNKND